MTVRRLALYPFLSIAILIATLVGASCSDRIESRRTAESRRAADVALARDTTTPATPATNVSNGLAHRRRSRRRTNEEQEDNDPDRKGLDGRPLPGTDYPGEAVRFRNLTLRDENGNIPVDGAIRAQAHVRQMQAAGVPQQVQQLEGSAGISRSTWSWIGPGNIGGRVRTIAIHPTVASTIFAGSVGGGIWVTTNSGTSWAPVDDFLPNLAVSSIVINPVQTNVMFAGTGEGFYNGDGIRGAGIFESVNGGTSWSQLTSTNNLNFYYVNRLAIAPDGGVLLAATRNGLFRSPDSGASFTPVITSGVGSGITDVAFDPTNAANAVASGFDGNAWYSIDGGVTWTAATGLPATTFSRVEIAYAPSSPSKVYASVDQNQGSIYASTNGGVSYSLVSNPAAHYLGSQGWYGNAIWVNPLDPNAIVVGGIDLYRSTNGGATISQISVWYNAPLSDHADHHVIVSPPDFDNTTNKKFYSGDDGGIYGAADWSTVGGGGASDCTAVSPFDCEAGWTSLNNNLGVTQFYGGSGNAGTGRILGGTQDNGTLVYNGNAQAWSTEFGGDGGFAAVDPTNTNNLYGEYVYLALHRSLTGSGGGADYIYGAFWNGSTYVCKSAPYFIPDVCSGGDLLGHANFIAPFILDPNLNTRLLAGGWSLWRTNDATTPNTSTTGPSWTSIKAPNAATSPISAIAVAPGNSDIIWVGHNNGDVFMTTNGTAVTPTWTRVDTGATPLPNRYVTRLTIDPTNPNIVYASLGGFSADNLYRTTNAGTTWTNIAGSGLTALPAVPVRDLKILPSNTNWLYAATDAGVFTSGDDGGTWGPPTTSPTDGPADVAVDELFFLDSQTLVAVTHGRGMFKTSITSSGGGHIGGTVKNGSNTPLAGATVRVYNGSGTLVATASTDASGSYTSADLGTGTYYAVASNPPTYVDQLYDGISCSPCTPTSGTPISVTAPNTTSNINFALVTRGQISGVVTAASQPQAFVQVWIFNSAGTFVSSSTSDASGNYVAQNLLSGTYYARTSNPFGLIDQLYNLIDCAGCNPTTGTPITVTAPNTTSGVNFNLAPGAQITGTVRAAGTNAPLANVVVAVYNSSGSQVKTWTTDASGNYAAKGLPTGSFFLRTFNNGGYVDQLYNGFSCAVSCTPNSGTPISVVAALTTPNINFTLTPPAVQSQGPNLGTFSIGEVEIPLSATGGNGTYTWSVVGGALPPGISLRTDGPSWFPSSASAGLDGVATAAGTYTFTLRVNSGGAIADQLCTVKVTSLTIKDGNHFYDLPDGFIGWPYSYTMTALNAAGAVTWTAGNLPPGLTISTVGVISGTPTIPGFYSGAFTVNDGVDTVHLNLTIPVNALKITNAGVLPNATQGQAYSTALTVGGGTAPYTFTGCCAPDGLSMNSAGVISGTPSSFATTGPTMLRVKATDANNQSVTKTFSLDVMASPVTLPGLIPYGNFDNCTVGMPCSRGFYVVSGGTAPFTWSATGMPVGVSIRSASGDQNAWVSYAPGWGTEVMAGNGELWGTPTLAGTYNIAVTATDALGVSVTDVFPLVVSALAQPNENGITPTLNSAFSAPIRVVGGTLPYGGTLVSGALPAGVTFNSGTMTISGTPLETGSFGPVFSFNDAASHTVRLTEAMIVNGPGSTLTIFNTTLGPAAAGSFFSTTLSACCANSYAWSFISGTMPPGLTLSSSGLLSGTLTTPGTYAFIVKAADASNPATFGQRQLTMKVVPAGTLLAITTSSSLPSGTLSVPYSQTLTSTGGTGAVSWSLAFNNFLPPGLTLSSAGVLSGTPTASGQFNFGVTASDSGGQTASRSFSLAIYAATTVDATPSTINAGGTLTVNWASIPAPTATDWIALVPGGANDGAQIAFRYLTGAASGSTTLVVPATAASGTYDVRLYTHDTLQRLARSSLITVTTPSLTAAPSTTPAGSSITLTWDHIGAPSASDWIAFAPAGSGNTTYDSHWIYTTGAAQGSLPYTIPNGAAPGQYEFHLFAHDTFQRLATSNPVTVVPVTASVTPASLLPGGTITIQWSGIGTPTATDWAAVIPTNGSDSSYVAWTYLTGTSAGITTLPLSLSIAPGTYEVRLFAKDTFKRLALSNTFTVLGATLNSTPSTVAPGGLLTLTWANIAAPTVADWLALEPVNGSDGSYIAWVLATGTANDSTTLPIPTSAPAGQYEVRLFSNNTFRLLAKSAQITITGPGPSVGASPGTVAPGGTLTASWRNIAAPTPRDWIGVYPISTSDDTAYLARFYTGGRISDRIVTTLASDLAPGQYELRLFSNDSFTRLASSNQFAVAAGATISGTPASVSAGGTLTVAWNGIATPTSTDWVALAAPNAPYASFIAFGYTTGTGSGTRALVVPANAPPGIYELRLFAHDGFQHLASSGAVMVGPAVVATPTLAAPGAMATVSWTGIPTPTAHDWLALVPLNAPDTSYVAWTYTDGRGSDRILFALPANLAVGAYDVRVFANDTFQRLAISNPIVVSGPASTVAVHPVIAAAGSTLTLDWHGIAAPAAGDWIGVYASGADDSAHVTQTFTNGSANGTVTVVLPGVIAAGEYEVRLFSNNSTTRLAVGNGFVVVAGAALQVLSTSAPRGSSITINWAGIATPTATDWVALAPMNSPDNGFVAWVYTTGTAAGSVSLQVPAGAALGPYEVRLYAHDTFQRLAVSNVIVVSP